MALPYLASVVDARHTAAGKGVVINNEPQTYKGLNLYSNHFVRPALATLIDMQGKIVHRWKNRHFNRFPWSHVTPLKDGGLIALHRFTDAGLFKISWDSKIEFTVVGDFHHDVTVAPDGTIYALDRHLRPLPEDKNTLFFDDRIVKISPDGKVLKYLSLYDLFQHRVNAAEIFRSLEERRLRGHNTSYLHLLHANTLDTVTSPFMGLSSKSGLLVCLRNLNLIALIDFDSGKILWEWGTAVLDRPHQPVILGNGNLLVFDNGWHRGWSRVIELNPPGLDIAWSYSDRSSFFTKERGGNQRLPNGNTLITVSDQGRVIEVTPQGKVVWEWHNPLIDKKTKHRAAIYRMQRLEPDFVNNVLRNGSN